MEKSGVALIYVVSIVVLAGLLMQLIQSKRKNVTELIILLVLGISMNATFMSSLFISDKFVLVLIYTAVLMFESWILFLFLRYAHRRTMAIEKRRENLAGAGMLLLVMDNAVLIMNAFTEVFFEFNIVEFGSSIYVRAEWSPFLLLHWCACLLIAIFITIIMCQKALRVAKIYRMRYWVGAVVFTIGMILEFLTRFISDNMNMWSVTLLSLGIVCYYFIYFLYPLMRTERMKTFAINNMSDPVLMFDYNNNLQVFNAAAERMLGVYPYYPMEKYIKESELYYTIEEHEKHKNNRNEFARTKIINGRTYHIKRTFTNDDEG